MILDRSELKLFHAAMALIEFEGNKRLHIVPYSIPDASFAFVYSAYPFSAQGIGASTLEKVQSVIQDLYIPSKERTWQRSR